MGGKGRKGRAEPPKKKPGYGPDSSIMQTVNSTTK